MTDTLTTAAVPGSGAENITLASGETFRTHLEAVLDAPHWLLDLKRTAWDRFQSLPMPRRTDESWRFSKVAGLDLAGYEVPTATRVKAPAVPVDGPIPDCAGVLEFVDDQLTGERLPSDDLRRAGVIFLPMDRALKECPELVREHLFERLPDIGCQKFEALHQALFVNGAFLYVPDGVVIEQPFAAVHHARESGSALFPHTLMVLGQGAKATLLDLFTGNGSGRHFICGMADICAGPQATTHYRAIQNWNLQTLALHLNAVTAGSGSYVKTINVHLGGQQVRNEQHGRVFGENADINMHSLGVVRGQQELDQRTLQTHHAGQSRSDLLYKNALLDEARTIFSGLIRVDEGAQQTDAYQTNRNLLLSPEADANSLPGLEIAANDVKCSHGATTGQLDDSDLFYFLARGIPKNKAHELLIFGFFEEIIDKFENTSLAEYVRNLVQHKFLDD